MFTGTSMVDFEPVIWVLVVVLVLLMMMITVTLCQLTDRSFAWAKLS